MATFQSQINILAAANCGIHSRINQLEKSRLEVNYNDTFTTIKDTHDDGYITINNLGYNAYDAMLIMKNSDDGAREYHLMGYDGKNIDLGKNTEVGGKIGKAMEAQTMKLLELKNITNERELLRWDFECTFDSSDIHIPLDETDFSIGYPIYIKQTPVDMNPSLITTSDLINFGDISYYTYNKIITSDPYQKITTNSTIGENDIIYKDYNTFKIPIGISDLTPASDGTEYCIKLNQRSVDTFTEKLTITSNPTFKFSNNVELTYDTGYNTKTVILESGRLLEILDYNNDTIYIGTGTDIISFKIINKKILRLATSFKLNTLTQYCYIKIKKEDISDLKINDKAATITEGLIDISFPWGLIDDNNLLTLTSGDNVLTKIDGGHLYSTANNLDDTYAKYKNINIINNMKPLQFDIMDETEETQPIISQQ